jgi:hypothetical protein
MLISNDSRWQDYNERVRTILLFIFFAASLNAGKPDFSGDWQTLKIQQKDSALTITSEEGTARYVIGEDAHWDGAALVLKNGDRYEFTRTPGQLQQSRQGRTRLFVATGTGKHATSNFDESKVGAYTLPDPLKLLNGERVTSAEMWNRLRRPELIRLFEENMYGRVPNPPRDLKFTVRSSPALAGKAIRKEVTISFPGHTEGPALHVLVYLPAHAAKPAPLFLGLNFSGNTAAEDPAKDGAHWPFAKLIDRGYGLATMWTGEMAPDNDKTLHSGIYAFFYPPGQAERKPDDWGAIAAWGWGLSRALDYLETDPAVDAKRVAVIGHSRNAKAVLWAGARDTRFAMVISNESGEGGAALSCRNFGETVQDLNTSFPHWFCENYRKYSGRAAESPVESNLLLSLIAPRPLYVASAQGDLWSDPKGEFLGALAAAPVYGLLGRTGLDASEFPAVEHPIVNSTVAYHIRTGKHDITDYDWEEYLQFADLHLLSK